MTEERDSKVSGRYRELSRDEPSREIDQTIIAAAHRAADRPHAPLVAPAGRHRWYYAFGAAAILMLAVAVTVHIERDGPDAEAIATAPVSPSPAAEPAPRAQQLPSEQFRDVVPAEPRIPEQRPQVAAPLRAPATIEALSTRRDAGLEQQTAPGAPPKPSADDARRQEALRTEALRKMEEYARASGRVERSAATAPVPMGRAANATKPEPPQRWLERIAQLRKDGRHDEADKELAEFRRHYPGYEVPQPARADSR